MKFIDPINSRIEYSMGNWIKSWANIKEARKQNNSVDYWIFVWASLSQNNNPLGIG